MSANPLAERESGLSPSGPHKAEQTEGQGQWIPVACWHNCGGRCLLKAWVVDGRVLRVKSDDTHPDSPDSPQLRACARGRAQRKQVLAPDRLRYPMKRKHWIPGGGRKDLRGRDQWVRICWDEALDILAGETRRIVDSYGNASLLVLSYEEGFQGVLFDPVPRVFRHLGGYTSHWGTVSWGSFPFPSLFMQGSLFENGNDRMDLLRSKLIVLWGTNPAVNRAGNAAYHILRAKEAGARILVVDPIYTESAKALADEWIPVRPGTDTALLLGVAHHMITCGLYDQDFLDRYTLGFDAGHMPEGADPRHNFKDYVLGTHDGVPKTAEWASRICGTDPHTIRGLASQMATVKPAAIISAWSVSKTYRGEQFVQAFFTVGWMTGNLGIPGGQVSWSGQSFGGKALVRLGRIREAMPDNALYPPKSKIANSYPNPLEKDWHALNWSECWDAVVKGEQDRAVHGKQPVDIRMIYHGHAAMLNQMPNLNRGIEAHRKVEFVASASQFLDTGAKYADLVLPVTTMWERHDTLMQANRETILWWRKALEPLFEAKDDMYIARGLAQRLGIDPGAVDPTPEAQKLYNQLAGAQVIKPDGSGYEPLFAISAEDIAELGGEGHPQAGRCDWRRFRKEGIFQVPRSPGDPFVHVSFQDFRRDPHAHPLRTASGKLEIHCETLAKVVNAYGWSRIEPIATYEPPIDGYEDARGSDYPLQLITPHHLRRAHSALDNVPWLREAFPQEFWMNDLDAGARDIANGDTVLVTSPHGALLRRAKVTPCIVPGAVALADGAWADIDEETGVDRAGSPNCVQAPPPSGHGVQAWTTTRVQVARHNRPLDPDHQWPKRIVP